jgi:hypothetical protein
VSFLGYAATMGVDYMDYLIADRTLIPETSRQHYAEKIAYLHIDMNEADAEIAALEALFDRVVPGGIVILDDYEWSSYRAQKLAEDPWFEARQYRVMPLPTGQGLNTYLRQYGGDTLELPVEQPEILLDLDTPTDYARWVARQADDRPPPGMASPHELGNDRPSPGAI